MIGGLGRCALLGPIAGLLACSNGASAAECIGTPSAEGHWAVFEGLAGDGQPCTTPAGDLHVRYERRDSDALVEMWRQLIPDKLEVELEEPWRARNQYRRAVYSERNGDRALLVDIVKTGGAPIRTVRLTWDPPE